MKKLKLICENCGHTFGAHRFSDEKCPDKETGDTYRNRITKFKRIDENGKDLYISN